MLFIQMYYNCFMIALKSSPMISMVKFNIQKFMKMKGVTVRELALRTGLSEVAIRNWFSAVNYAPSLPNLEKVCIALEIQPFELFYDETDDVVPLSREKRALLNKYDLLNDKQKEAMMTMLESYF